IIETLNTNTHEIRARIHMSTLDHADHSITHLHSSHHLRFIATDDFFGLIEALGFPRGTVAIDFDFNVGAMEADGGFPFADVFITVSAWSLPPMLFSFPPCFP